MRKERTGLVLSDKMSKTRVVRVERLVQHPLYKKTLKVRTKYYAHDEQNKSKQGDKVRLLETKPSSKLKRWEIVEVVS